VNEKDPLSGFKVAIKGNKCLLFRDVLYNFFDYIFPEIRTQKPFSYHKEVKN